MMSDFSAILFDLDGTLVDTAPALAYALNRVLEEHDQQPLPYEIIRPVASHGSLGLLDLGFGITPEHEDYKPLQKRFLTIYEQNLTYGAVLFKGMEQVIDALDNRDITWGIVTNKPAFLTDSLLAQLGIAERAACMVSGDTTAYSKPHPEPMLHASDVINHAPENCIYIGDAERDINAGKNANMKTVTARYGYLSEHDIPEDWQADDIIDHPTEILKWI